MSKIDRPESSHKLDHVVDANKKTAISMMARIFKKNMESQVKNWHHNALPEKRLEAISSEMMNKSKDDYEYVAKIGAVECLSKISHQVVYKSKVKAFRLISQHMYNKRNETDHDESWLDLLNRLNVMMEEIRTYKEENESLAYEVENKDRSLRESNETVTILSLRINYMITQKFLNMIEKVYESIEYRHLNDAFDVLIDEANENL